MNTPKDQIYRISIPHSKAKSGSFVFDERVAAVFNDMISRSVPGYQQILEMLPTLTRHFRVSGMNYYDLGCSLGASMLAMAEGLRGEKANLIGIDNSSAMIEKAALNVNNLKSPQLHVTLLKQDLLTTNIHDSAMVIMNFTLQFIALKQRDALIAKIHSGLLNGGALVLSEKIKFNDTRTNNILIDIHHQYKSDQGYSQLEIAQKRDAIENILMPETLEEHIARLKKIGFNAVTPWVQNLQFISILAIK